MLTLNYMTFLTARDVGGQPKPKVQHFKRSCFAQQCKQHEGIDGLGELGCYAQFLQRVVHKGLLSQRGV